MTLGKRGKKKDIFFLCTGGGVGVLGVFGGEGDKGRIRSPRRLRGSGAVLSQSPSPTPGGGVRGFRGCSAGCPAERGDFGRL